MRFDDWWEGNNSVPYDNEHTKELAKSAWDYQQELINELEKDLFIILTDIEFAHINSARIPMGIAEKAMEMLKRLKGSE